ncbi:MAG: methionyl-tRNA formyltransferase [Spirochaetaceae bacterium]
MRLLYAGTPDIAVPALRDVSAEFPVVGVLTAPDARRGRGRKLRPPPVKEAAVELGVPVLQPLRLDEEARALVRELFPDMLVSFAYGKIFGPKFMDIFPEGGLNVHPSLLPKYRGPAPIPAVILSGETETGITVQYLAEKMDAGAVVVQERMPLDGDETAESLSNRVAQAAGGVLLRALREITAGTAAPVPQVEEEATYCTFIRKEDGQIDWRSTSVQIERMVRAYTPWPGAHTYWEGRALTIREAVAVDSAKDPGYPASPAEPGRVVGVDRGTGILIQTGNGMLAVRRLQLQGGKTVDWKSFMNGHGDFTRAVLSSL